MDSPWLKLMISRKSQARARRQDKQATQVTGVNTEDRKHQAFLTSAEKVVASISGQSDHSNFRGGLTYNHLAVDAEREYIKALPGTIRRFREENAEGSHTKQEWIELVARYGGKCVGCGYSGPKLTKDHIVPISKGGTHNIDNIQPLCRSCNSKKGVQSIDLR